MRFNNFDKNFFEENGFIILKQKIDTDLIKNIRIQFEKIYNQVRNGKYQYFRIYDDYINSPNISAIEMIFHKKIYNTKIAQFINASQIPEISKTLLGDQLKMTLSRYHITRNYSHIGEWHRDKDKGNTRSLQFQYYLYDEKGLEIIPKSHNREFNNDEIFKLNKSKYSKLKDSVHIETKSGDLLIFKPSIIHRGITKNNRVNMHFKIEKDENYKFIKIKNYTELNENWSNIIHNNNSVIYNERIPKIFLDKSMKTKILRLMNTLMHYLLFFFPYNSKIFKKTGSRPSLKLRSMFRIN